MNRNTVATVAALACIVLTTATPANAKPKYGVSGSIDGKAFKATNKTGDHDLCASGIFQPGPGGPGSMVFQALECRAKRRRTVPLLKKNYRNIVITCSKFDWNLDTTTYPWEMVCGAGCVYQENKTGRFGVPLSSSTWLGTSDVLADPPTGSLTARIDGVEGNVVRGVITGAFDSPPAGGPDSPATIDGELRFEFPFQIQ